MFKINEREYEIIGKYKPARLFLRSLLPLDPFCVHDLTLFCPLIGAAEPTAFSCTRGQ